MNFKTTLVLLLLVALGGAIWYFSTGSDDGDDSSADSTSVTQNVMEDRPALEEIGRIEVRRAGEPTIVFERVAEAPIAGQTGVWRMTAPVEAFAVPKRVESLVVLARGLQSTQQLPIGGRGISLEDAGLAPSSGSFVFAKADGKQYVLHLGKAVPMTSSWYVRVGDEDRIQVVRRSFQADLDNGPAYYRSRQVFEQKLGDVAAVETVFAGETYRMERATSAAGGDTWRLTAPIDTLGNQQRIDTYVRTLVGVPIAEFVDQRGDPASFGLSEPYLRIKLDPDAAEADAAPPAPIVLDIGAFADLSQETRYIQLDGADWIATANNTILENLVPVLAELRDTRVLPLTPSAIDAVEFRRGDGATAVRREDGVWRGADGAASIDVTVVQSAVDALVRLRAVEFIDNPEDLAAYGLDQPRGELIVTTSDNDTPQRLLIGADTASGINTHVMLAGGDSVAIAPAAEVAKLLVSRLDLRDKTLIDAKPEEVHWIEMQRGKVHYRLVRAGDGAWALEEPGGATADAATAREWANNLARLRAVRVVGDEDFGAYGLETPYMEIRVALKQAPEAADAEGPPADDAEATYVEHSVGIQETDVGVMCRVDDEPTVFALAPGVYNVFDQEAINRAVFEVDPSAIAEIQIDAPGGALHVARTEDGWEFVGDASVQLSKTKVGELAADLGELRVERYIEYQDADFDAAGLTDAPATIAFALDDGAAYTLKLQQVQTGELPRLAGWVERGRTFLIDAARVERLLRGLDAYLKRAEPQQPGMPPTP